MGTRIRNQVIASAKPMLTEHIERHCPWELIPNYAILYSEHYHPRHCLQREIDFPFDSFCDVSGVFEK